MALVKCHECGNEISTEAKACPQCGAKNKSRTPAVRKSLQIIGLIIIGGFVYAIFTLDPMYRIPECHEASFKEQFEELFDDSPFALQNNLKVIDIKEVKDVSTSTERIDRQCEVTFELNNQQIGTHLVYFEYTENKESILIKASSK